MFRLPSSSGSSVSTVGMCKGCGGVAAQKNIAVSAATGFCGECDSAKSLPSTSRSSPRTQQLLQRSLESALHPSSRLQSVTGESAQT